MVNYPAPIGPTYRVLPFKCQLITRDDKYDDGCEMKMLIWEQLWQHLKPLDGQEEMTTSTSSSILHLDVTKCKITTNYNSCFSNTVF